MGSHDFTPSHSFYSWPWIRPRPISLSPVSSVWNICGSASSNTVATPSQSRHLSSPFLKTSRPTSNGRPTDRPYRRTWLGNFTFKRWKVQWKGRWIFPDRQHRWKGYHHAQPFEVWIIFSSTDYPSVLKLPYFSGSYTHAWMLKEHPNIVARSCFVDPVTFCSWEGGQWPLLI